MANDRVVGGAILGGSIVGIIIYGLLLYSQWSLLVLQISAFLAVLALLGILAWIGYTMATTPPPEPIADIPKVTPEEPAGAADQKKE
jgi:predicted DNA-binding transcriptional regulator